MAQHRGDATFRAELATMAEMMTDERQQIARLEARDRHRDEQLQILSELWSTKPAPQQQAMGSTPSNSTSSSVASYMRSLYQDVKKSFGDRASRRAMAQAHLGTRCRATDAAAERSRRDAARRRYSSPSTLGRL
mmetsp:Transcript_49663/g.144398  ORF Transcript_49663/g.144398 Transcript_49663/m.144398 type:complete len:134 (-) Transcript_49663:407-808(-)